METSGLELERLTVRGTPAQMGRAYGEHFRERIAAFVADRFEYLHVWAGDRGVHEVEHRSVMELGRRSMEMAAGWAPRVHEEHLGLALGAGLDPVELYAAANLTDLRDAVVFGDDEGCSSLILPGACTRDGEAIAGQTWDLNFRDIQYVVAIERVPDQGPRTWSVTCAGCLTLMGINEHGVALGTTNIKTRGAGAGVGYLSLLHAAIACGSASAAADLIASAPRAGAHTYWIADPEVQLELETVPGSHVTRRGDQDVPIYRTNHCLNPAYTEIEAEPAGPSSLRRFARLGELTGQGEIKHSVESVKAIFADREAGELSINRYAEDGGRVATNAVFIALPAQRKALACRGSADRGVWVELGFEQETQG